MGEVQSRTTQKYSQVPAFRAVHHNVEESVAIQISSGDAVWPVTALQRKALGTRRAESSFAVSQQDRHCHLFGSGDIALIGNDGQVGFPIAIEVSDCHFPWLCSRRKW